MTTEPGPIDLPSIKARLAARLQEQQRHLFGNTSPAWLDFVTERNWDEARQAFRLNDLVRHGFRRGQARVLEVGAGCGPFVSHALNEGYDCWGIEPEAWKVEMFRRKCQALRQGDTWATRMLTSPAETLPFGDETFDCVSSAQFIEHVSDPERALREMVRVTRTGGGICLRCPDYGGTYEPHYRLPWLPLFPRPLANAYLRRLGRPVEGLSTLRYVTSGRILRWLLTIEERGRRLVVIDDHRTTFDNALRRRRLPNVPGAFAMWSVGQYLRALGRSEIGISLFVRIVR